MSKESEFQQSRRLDFEPGKAGGEAAPAKSRGDGAGFKGKDAGEDENRFFTHIRYNMTERINPYTRTNPLNVSIRERHLLCKPGSAKRTSHIVLELPDPAFTYEVGDSIGVYSPNDAAIVDKTLQAMGCTGDETVVSKRTGETFSFRDFLIHSASITDFSKKMLKDIMERQTNSEKRAHLESIFADKEQVKAYIKNRQVWDLMLDHSEVRFTSQEYADVLMPNLPRLYSIASSQLVTPNEVHLTVALTEYETNGHRRYGVCTHYLCNLAPLGVAEIPIYLQPHKGFTLPEDPEASIIMVGPGTGIAPFRAFMQERQATDAPGRNWLFFGEWTQKLEYFYEDEWKDLVMQGKLELDTAFSRDQEHKVYVQHRMLERAEELFAWIDAGAYFYVCGDMHSMARDVDDALHRIVEEQGNMSAEEAKDYVKDLRQQKRYLRDVY